MAEFHFIRPAFLLCLLPVLWVLWRRPGQQGWSDILPGHLAQVLVTSQGASKSLAVPALIWLLMTLALAGPSWQKTQLPVYQLNQGAIIIADMTLSMYATDVAPDRLTRARYKIIDLLAQIKDGDVGLVAYSGDAFVISPLTPDRNNIIQLLPALSPEIMPAIGSNPVAALELAARLLKDSGHSRGDIYWITDGIHGKNESAVKNWITKSNYPVSALLIGTEAGAPIRLPRGELLKDTQGNIIVPGVELATMQRVITTGHLSQQTGDDQDVQSLVSELISERKLSESQREGDEWQDFGPYLVLVILPLFVWFFRKGGLLIGLVLVLLQPEKPLYADAVDETASATQQHGFSWISLFSNQNQKASQLFESSRYSEAATAFTDPNWQASAHYRAGDFQQALEQYQAQVGSNDSADLQYNIGNTLAQLGQLDEAITAYDHVLQLQPDHEDALANKALLEKLKSEEQQNQNQDQNDNQDQSQQNQNQDQEPQQNNSGDSQSGQQPSTDSQPPSESEQPPGDTSSEAESEVKPQETAEGEEVNADEPSQSSSVEMPFEELTPEEQQRMNQLINQVTDDPSLLLRNKMLLNYQTRQQQKQQSGQNTEELFTW